MPEHLMIRFADQPADAVEWQVVDTHGNRVGLPQQSDLDTVTPQAAGRIVTVLIPGAEVTLQTVSLPVRNTQKLLQAVPYALEDRVAEDVENLHFALGNRTQDGARVVAVIRRDILGGFLQRLQQADIHADEVTPDYLALPVQPEQATVALCSGQLLFCDAAQGGFTLDLDTGIAVLASRYSRQTEHLAAPSRVLLLVGPDNDAAADELSAILNAAEITVDRQTFSRSLLTVISPGQPSRRLLNLLQGVFQPKSNLEKYWRPWRMTAFLAAIWLLTLGIQQGLAYYQVRHAAEEMQTQSIALYKRMFPDIRNIDTSDPHVMQIRAQRHIDALNSGSGNAKTGFLAILESVGVAVSAEPKTRITGFSYQDGVMELSIETTGIPVLDKLKKAISTGTGFTVDIDSANTGGGKVQGRLTIREGGSS